MKRVRFITIFKKTQRRSQVQFIERSYMILVRRVLCQEIEQHWEKQSVQYKQFHQEQEK